MPDEIEHLGSINDEGLTDFLHRLVVLFVDELMSVLADHVLFLELLHPVEFVEMGLQHFPDPQHHIQHQVPTLVPKVYYIFAALHRSCHVRVGLLLAPCRVHLFFFLLVGLQLVLREQSASYF